MSKPNKQLAQEHKDKGNKLFASEKYAESLIWYVKAIQADPTDHVLYSNKSAAHAGNKEFDKALEAADQCIKLNAKWPKGYYRKAVALMSLNRNEDAITTLNKGLTYEPTNADLLNKLQEAKSKGKPQGGALSQGLEAKAEGNAHFKESRYEKAIEAYTRALQTVTDENEKSVIYSNRAACYYQLRNFEEVVADSTESLTLSPTNAKSLLRRGLAYESLEKQKLALQDLQQVLALEPNTSVALQAVGRIRTAMARWEKRAN
jgi:stress-induced-phosphoprotein 1